MMENLVPLKDYCRKNDWPRLPQWRHWITQKNDIAKACVKKIGGRYVIDLEAFGNYVKNATLEERV